MRLLELVLALLLGVAPAQTMAESSVQTGVEAWYHITPQPQPDAPPVNPYEAETLHVGASAGAERARIYLTLLVADLPPGATITGGTLTLPVHPGASTRPEAARIRVCASERPTTSVQGSFGPPPAVDCSASAEARYEAGGLPRFTVDLAPFDDLRGSGLALLAAPGTTETWDVALYAKGHPAERPITATVSFTPATFDAGEIDEDGSGFSPDPGVDLEWPEGPAPTTSTDPRVDPLAQTADPSPSGEAEPVSADGFVGELASSYLSWVLLVPLVVLAFAVYFSRALVVEEEEEV
ncbi:MAG TPA: hypothetical protein VM840_06300 [Actinomycetota bacterium]|nr:hypothetical protein [Actinomycetota bacterium]